MIAEVSLAKIWNEHLFSTTRRDSYELWLRIFTSLSLLCLINEKNNSLAKGNNIGPCFHLSPESI